MPSGIRTRIPSKGAAADLRIRPRGHWDRLRILLVDNITSGVATTLLLQVAPKHNIDIVYMSIRPIVNGVLEDRLPKVDS